MTDEQLTNAMRRLVAMMDDPHPGLSTWHEARVRLAHTVYTGLVERIEPAHVGKSLPNDREVG